MKGKTFSPWYWFLVAWLILIGISFWAERDVETLSYAEFRQSLEEH